MEYEEGSTALRQKIQVLEGYSACDVSDALLKIDKTSPGQVARAGFLADLVQRSPSKADLAPDIIKPRIAPAYTIKCISKSDTTFKAEDLDPANTFPKDEHWVDSIQSDHIVVMEQPNGQFCAVLGGIMATRMAHLGAKGIVVDGRVRDQVELRETGLPIFARGISTVGVAAEAKVVARNVPVMISGVQVSPGDLIFCDPVEGAVVAIPLDLLDEVLQLMPKLKAADDRVMQDLMSGSSVFEAFRKHRADI